MTEEMSTLCTGDPCPDGVVILQKEPWLWWIDYDCSDIDMSLELETLHVRVDEGLLGRRRRSFSSSLVVMQVGREGDHFR